MVSWDALRVSGYKRLELEREVENAQLLQSFAVFFDSFLSGLLVLRHFLGLGALRLAILDFVARVCGGFYSYASLSHRVVNEIYLYLSMCV